MSATVTHSSQVFIFSHFQLLFPLVIAWNGLAIAALLVWRRRHGPQFPPKSTVNIVFQERGASGSSRKNGWTRFGGASRCLTVILTTEELWITTYFPFTAFIGICDLEHRIPLRDLLAVTPVERRRLPLLITSNDQWLEIRFRLPGGTQQERTLLILLSRTEEFMQLLPAGVVKTQVQTAGCGAARLPGQSPVFFRQAAFDRGRPAVASRSRGVRAGIGMLLPCHVRANFSLPGRKLKQ